MIGKIATQVAGFVGQHLPPAMGIPQNPLEPVAQIVTLQKKLRETESLPAWLRYQHMNLCHETLAEILKDQSPANDDAFPQMSREHYMAFLQYVPQLFRQGNQVMRELEGEIKKDPKVRLIKRLVERAALTAPSDLWMMRQILGTYAELGLLNDLASGKKIDLRAYAASHNLDQKQFRIDMEFLYSRGYFRKIANETYVCDDPFAVDLFQNTKPVPEKFQCDMTQELISWFKGEQSPEAAEKIKEWLTLDPKMVGESRMSNDWRAGIYEMELGYRLVPLILALKASNLLSEDGFLTNPAFTSEMKVILENAGYLEGNKITDLGRRLSLMAPGVFGIIGAYQDHLVQHKGLLQGHGNKPNVKRGANVAASLEANVASFQDAIDCIDTYEREKGKKFKVIIEHAMGLGAGIELALNKFGTEGRTYIGAEYERAAIDAAEKHKGKRLPADLDIVQADIADPDKLIEFIKAKGLDPADAVMIVGNGFHEVRGLTDDTIQKVFNKLRAAGITLVFTEEVGLSSDEILESGWNTYHAGFRWVHETSGQVLRSLYSREGMRMSWLSVLNATRYKAAAFKKKRPVFPCPMPENENQPISVTILAEPIKKAA